MAFPVVLNGCESWTIKNVECQRIDAFELWCWRRLSRVPWTARRSSHGNPKGNQSWIYIGRTDAGAKSPIFWPPDAKNWLTGKTLMLGKIEGRRRRGQQRMRSLSWWTWVWASSESWWWTGKPGMLQSMGSQSQAQLSNWAEWTECFRKASPNKTVHLFNSC